MLLRGFSEMIRIKCLISSQLKERANVTDGARGFHHSPVRVHFWILNFPASCVLDIEEAQSPLVGVGHRRVDRLGLRWGPRQRREDLCARNRGSLDSRAVTTVPKVPAGSDVQL